MKKKKKILKKKRYLEIYKKPLPKGNLNDFFIKLSTYVDLFVNSKIFEERLKEVKY